MSNQTEQPGGVGEDANGIAVDDQSVAIVYQLIEDGVPVMACLLHPEPFNPELCRHDARLPLEVVQVPLPSWWDGWIDLGDGWFAARIDMQAALIAALLVGASGKDQVRSRSRHAIGKIVEQADAVLKVPGTSEERHNPDLDDIMAA